MAYTKPTHQPQHSSSGVPSQKALNLLYDRYIWFMAKRETERRAKRLKGRNRAASIKI